LTGTLPQFGDKARVATAPATVAAGVAGKTGIVSGVTTPSITNVTVIGDLVADVAICVMFEETRQDVWLTPDLVEVLDHNPGTTMTFDGVPLTYVREADGNWKEVPRRLPIREWPAYLRTKFRDWWNPE
jgi:hypothetical protein